MASYPTRLTVPERNAARCESQKMAYDTCSVANDVAEVMMSLGKVEPGCHLTPYFCDERWHNCRRWHIYNRKIVFPKD